jgi:DNA-binding CsgD family transcriptional regulator
VTDLARVLAELEGDGVGPALMQLTFPAALVDGEGVVQWENAAAVETSGSSLGAPFIALARPETRTELEQWFDERMRRRDAGECVAELKLADGRFAPFEISVVPLRSDGLIVGAFGIGSMVGQAEAPGKAVTLTQRQRDVLRLLGEGKSTAQIARELVLSETTVRNHVAAVLAALGVNSRLQAVLEARRAGLLVGPYSGRRSASDAEPRREQPGDN